MKKIIYNKKQCIGCSVCTTKAPNIWQLNAVDGKAELLDAELKKDNYFRMLWPDEIEIMIEIVELCPAKVIRIL